MSERYDDENAGALPDALDDPPSDQDDDTPDNLPTLYIDGLRVSDARDQDGYGARDQYGYGADLDYIERVQLEFDDAANGVQSDAQEARPLGWLNSATIHLDRAEDSVTVSISVGDPRGAFGFTIRRIPADNDQGNAGLLIMHTPYPGESAPHVDTFPIRPGTLAIGREWRS